MNMKSPDVNSRHDLVRRVHLVGRASLPAINFAGRDACATEPAPATGKPPGVLKNT